MPQIKPGDVVTRKSYSGDIFFKVVKIKHGGKKETAVLKGMDVRLLADAPVSDLELKDATDIFKFRHNCIQRNMDYMKKIHSERSEMREKRLLRGGQNGDEFYEIPGKVLHLDGDEEYLVKCLATYKQVDVDAVGFTIDEEEQPQKVVSLLKEYKPDILILTGHDAFIKGAEDFSKIDNYRNSRYFVEGVSKARQYEPSKDQLVMFAGACQSHYEALIEAGANFASSPQRIFIHAYDPVFLVQKISYAPIYQRLSLKDLISNTITGKDGVGGIETKGCFRLGFPKSPY